MTSGISRVGWQKVLYSTTPLAYPGTVEGKATVEGQASQIEPAVQEAAEE